ncbi:hypothetical protein J6590_057458 [Homalodisca vitripennis]|nr:hypothetical protein J6590_057458 [Homalodisca vitripennis]
MVERRKTRLDEISCWASIGAKHFRALADLMYLWRYEKCNYNEVKKPASRPETLVTKRVFLKGICLDSYREQSVLSKIRLSSSRENVVCIL